ncbi:MAG TPA: hypothetical protein VFZ65_07965 [Planctomycetota bacterium]|nr:hypothetical protein [Planctomycetota bacterium]
MQKSDAFFLLCVLGGGGYAIYSHWDAIVEKLGLDDLGPARMKAIQLAKHSSDFEAGVTNWQYVETRQKRGEIEVAAEPWSAEPVGGQDYRVLVRWLDGGERVVLAFKVNVADRTVAYQGSLTDAAAPR